MTQLKERHFVLFRILSTHCSFLTRRQIESIWSLPTNTTNKELSWLRSRRYLRRRNRGDTFHHFQTPIHYLGEFGWQAIGKRAGEYRKYRSQVETRAERTLEHSLMIHDVFLKFILETTVRRIIKSEDAFWNEVIDLGVIPDGWIQFPGGEVFLEVDRGSESPIVVQKKLEKYEAFRKSGRYDATFPGCTFKILFFTTSDARIESLQRIKKSDDIWYCVLNEFVREPLTHQHWFALYGFYYLSDLTKKVL